MSATCQTLVPPQNFNPASMTHMEVIPGVLCGKPAVHTGPFGAWCATHAPSSFAETEAGKGGGWTFACDTEYGPGLATRIRDRMALEREKVATDFEKRLAALEDKVRERNADRCREIDGLKARIDALETGRPWGIGNGVLPRLDAAEKALSRAEDHIARLVKANGERVNITQRTGPLCARCGCGVIAHYLAEGEAAKCKGFLHEGICTRCGVAVPACGEGGWSRGHDSVLCPACGLKGCEREILAAEAGRWKGDRELPPAHVAGQFASCPTCGVKFATTVEKMAHYSMGCGPVLERDEAARAGVWGDARNLALDEPRGWLPAVATAGRLIASVAAAAGLVVLGSFAWQHAAGLRAWVGF